MLYLPSITVDLKSSASANSATPAQEMWSYKARGEAHALPTRSRGCKLRGSPKISRRMAQFRPSRITGKSSLTISAKPVGVRAASQRLIPTGERSSLLMRTARRRFGASGRMQPRVIRVTAMSKLLSSSSSAWRLQQIDAAQIDDDDMTFWTVNPKMVKGRLRTRVLGNFY